MKSSDTLIRYLQNCERVSDLCARECLKENGVSSMKNCIKLAWDCADFCNLATTILNRISDRKRFIIETCIEVCTECADECEKFDREYCQKCANACRLCVDHCRQFLKLKHETA
jgi:hypothetical protein